MRSGILHAQGDIVMFTDADLSAPMDEASACLPLSPMAPTSLSVPAGSKAAARRTASPFTVNFLGAASTRFAAW